MDAPAKIRRGGVHVTLHVRGVISGGIKPGHLGLSGL